MVSIANELTEEKIRELLQPLYIENAGADYRLLSKAIIDFKHKLQHLESIYTDAYVHLCSLEQKAEQYRACSLT
jgi:hypothetical protein